MSEIRAALDQDQFPEFVKEFHQNRQIGVIEATG
jgi:queuine tRNA-ribosyltransferase